MVTNRESAAITGAGWTTPLGNELETVWQKLLSGHDSFCEQPSAYKLKNSLCALIPDLAYELPVSERWLEMSVRAITTALRAASLDFKDERIVTVIGTSFGNILEKENAGHDESAPLFEDFAKGLRRRLNLARPPVFVSTACSSGSDALAVGFDLIKSGAAEICLCGGTDVLTDIKRLAHSTLGTLSPTLLRAFDNRHDGTLLGEGAAFVVLEKNALAQSRRVLGRMLGYGAANDAASMTAPEPNALGGKLAVERALFSGGLAPEEIAAFCAHGSGTVINDSNERNILNSAFKGSKKPVVFATKGALGHSLGATGAIEAIALLLALQTKSAPPVKHVDEIDPLLEVPLAIDKPSELSGQVGLSLTLGFGGFNTCLALKA